MRNICHFDMSSGFQNIYKVVFTPLIFPRVLFHFFFLVKVFYKFIQIIKHQAMKSKNMIVNCKAESVETAVLKLCVEKLVENRFIFIMGKECIRRKKKGGHYFWFLMSSSIWVISHWVLVVCVMNRRLRFTSKWNWTSRLCRIAINLREKKAK